MVGLTVFKRFLEFEYLVKFMKLFGLDLKILS